MQILLLTADAQLESPTQFVNEVHCLRHRPVIRLNRDTDDFEGGVIILGSGPQASKGTGGAITYHQILGVDALCLHLPHDLRHCLNIAGGADYGLAAYRHGEDLLATGRILCNHLFSTCVHELLLCRIPLCLRQGVCCRGIREVDVRSHKPVQQYIAGHILRLAAL